MGIIKGWDVQKKECEEAAKPGITVLGFVEPWNGSRTKLILCCEKHGEWRTTAINYFKRSGGACTSCRNERNSAARISLEDHIKKCKELCPEYIEILGVVEDLGHTAKTKLILSCRIHNIRWEKSTIDNFKKHKGGCPKCASMRSTEGRLASGVVAPPRPDEKHIKDFIATNMFAKGTTFTRSEKLNKKGDKVYWVVTCPICAQDEFAKARVDDGSFECHISSLKLGLLPCRCTVRHKFSLNEWRYRLKSACERGGYTFIDDKEKYSSETKITFLCPIHGEEVMQANKLMSGQQCPECKGKTQKEAYINIVKDENDKDCALKFGIANKARSRIPGQNRNNVFQMQKKAVYEFPTVAQCKAAEKACKQRLECEVLNKFQLKDGFTETTYLSNYAKIVAIFEEFGGVLQK